MRPTIRLGQIAGIDIGLHWTVIVIGWLIAWSFSTGMLPETWPGYGPGQYWVAGSAIAGLFLASIVAHELSHSIVARRAGVRVRDITLWMLGGVSTLEDESHNADDELRISVVGPASSLALFVGFAAVAVAAEVAGFPTLGVAVPSTLSALNLLLAVFNLLPAYPLDGGRVLRALLWRRSGDRLQATRTAATIGRGFGGAFIGLGILLLTTGAAVNGVWLAFIGLFVLFASTMEAAQTESRALLSGVRVADVMTPDPITAPADASVDVLLHDYVLRTRASSYPVIDSGRTVGLVTLARIRAVPATQRDALSVRAIACPLSEVVIAHPDDDLSDLLPRLATTQEGRALVMEGDRLVGIISHSDVTRALEIRQLAGPGEPAASR